MPQKLAATSNESETLAIVSIESEDSGSGETIARIRLGGMSPRADDTNGPGRRMEMSKGQVDESEGWTDESRARADASTTPNEAKTVIVSHRTGAGTYLSTGDTKRAVDETDGIGSHADASSGHRDAPTTSNGAKRAGISYGDEPDTYLSVRAANRTVDETDGTESHADALSGHRDTLNASNGAVMGSMSCRGSAETYLGAADAKCAIDETECARSHADMSTGHGDALSVETDAPNASNNPGTGGISNGEGVSTYLGTRDTNRAVNETDGFGSRTDTSSGLTEVPSVETDAITTVNAPGIVSTHPIEPEMPDLPSQGTEHRADTPNGSGNRADTLSRLSDVPSVANDASIPANKAETVSTQRTESEAPNSPTGTEKRPDRTRHPADTSNGRMDVPSIGNDARTTTNAPQIVRMPRKRSKNPNSPIGATRQRSDEPNACGNHADRSCMHTDVQSGGNERGTAVNTPETIRTRLNTPKSQNPPAGSATSCSDATDGFGNHTDTSSARMHVQSVETDTKRLKTRSKTLERIKSA